VTDHKTKINKNSIPKAFQLYCFASSGSFQSK